MSLSVTRVLAVAGVVDHSFCTMEAAQRGSDVHKAIADIRRGKNPLVYPQIWGYVSAFERFVRETDFEVFESEVDLGDRCLGLLGHADAVGTLQGRPTIADYKTSKSGIVHPATGLQLALYGFLWNKHRWWLRVGVGLMPSGRYKLRIWSWRSWPSDLAVAKACVRIAQGSMRDSDWQRVKDWKRRNKAA